MLKLEGRQKIGKTLEEWMHHHVGTTQAKVDGGGFAEVAVKDGCWFCQSNLWFQQQQDGREHAAAT